jgi:NAD(P)H-dependent flavin oxidoreductase YrpB (nitropropane dioxygenase family)
MLRTAFTDLVGCQVPIQLAPMGGGVVTPELAMAVSRAGGLGMLQRADPTPWSCPALMDTVVRRRVLLVCAAARS